MVIVDSSSILKQATKFNKLSEQDLIKMSNGDSNELALLKLEKDLIVSFSDNLINSIMSIKLD